jgi:hypothetical protein
LVGVFDGAYVKMIAVEGKKERKKERKKKRERDRNC